MVIKKKQKKINKFANKYIDRGYKTNWNYIKLSKANSKEHNKRVCQICLYLLHNDITFATEVYFKSSYKPDIIAPSHIKPIIEVRHSEGEDRTMEKMSKIPDELKDEIIYVNTEEEWHKNMIL